MAGTEQPRLQLAKRGDSAGLSSHMTGIALVLFSSIAWGSAGLFIKLLPYDTWTIVFWRGVFAVLMIGAYVVWHHRRAAWSVLVTFTRPDAIATFFTAVSIPLFIPAFQHTSAANVLIIYATAPFMTAGLGYLFLRERPAVSTLAAAAVALAGVAIMFGSDAAGFRSGDLFALAATAVMAALTISVRGGPALDMTVIVLRAMIVTTILSLPLADQIGEIDGLGLLYCFGFAFFCMAMGLMLYMAGAARIPSALAILIGMAEVPSGVLLVWAGVGETPSAATLTGGAVVLAAVAGSIIFDQWRRPGGQAAAPIEATH